MSDTKMACLTGIKPGDIIKIAGMDFIVFPEINGNIPVVLKDTVFRSRFGNNNEFRNSDILKRLQEEFLPKIIEAVGGENVLEFETDLVTLDGLKNYGTMRSRISLPTLDFYRANVEIFDKHNPGVWWWLATADSAKPHFDPTWVLVVSPAGGIGGVNYNYFSGGVRPFLILKSSIFDSCEE